MAQVIVRNLEDDVRDKLRDRAAAHGCSMEEEIRIILREAVLRDPAVPDVGFGSRAAKRFQKIGLEREIEELRGGPPRAAEFGE